MHGGGLKCVSGKESTAVIRQNSTTWPWSVCSSGDQKPWDKVVQSWKHWPSHLLMASNLLEQPLNNPTQRPPVCHRCGHSPTHLQNNWAERIALTRNQLLGTNPQTRPHPNLKGHGQSGIVVPHHRLMTCAVISQSDPKTEFQFTGNLSISKSRFFNPKIIIMKKG